jgi:type II secretory pathway pseudopilin PulG
VRHSPSQTAGFSLVEIALALGVATFCLLAVLGLLAAGLQTQQASIQQTTATQVLSIFAADLRASVRYPPGLDDKLNCQQRNIRSHWCRVGRPDVIYFTNEGFQTGGLTPSSPPSDAVFRLILTYLIPPVETTSLSNITVTWPAQVDPATGTPAGKVQTFVAINRSGAVCNPNDPSCN